MGKIEKTYNLNVTEVRYPAFPMLFHGIVNFTVGILMSGKNGSRLPNRDKLHCKPPWCHRDSLSTGSNYGQTVSVLPATFLYVIENRALAGQATLKNNPTKVFFSGPEGSNQIEHIDQQCLTQFQKVFNLMVEVFNLKSQILKG